MICRISQKKTRSQTQKTWEFRGAQQSTINQSTFLLTGEEPDALFRFSRIYLHVKWLFLWLVLKKILLSTKIIAPIIIKTAFSFAFYKPNYTNFLKPLFYTSKKILCYFLESTTSINGFWYNWNIHSIT